MTGASLNCPRPPKHGNKFGWSSKEDHEQYTDIPSTDWGEHTTTYVPGCLGLAAVV